MYLLTHAPRTRTPWNKGKITCQKAPLKPAEICAIRVRLQLNNRVRDLALFNLAIDSMLRGCDLVKIRLSEVSHGSQIAHRAIIMQQKTHRPVQFELTAQTRESISQWIAYAGIGVDDCLFKSRNRQSEHISTRQYARIVDSWVRQIGLDTADYGTHSMRSLSWCE